MKYKLTEETKEILGRTLHRIVCVTAFGSVSAGDVGGWVESEKNLDQSGNAWVYGDARVYGNASVSGNARVYGDAWVYGDAEVYGDARVSGNADFIVLKNNWSSGRCFTYTRSNEKWKVGCFYGTGAELIAKAYNDSELSGKCYEASVNYVESIYKILEEIKKNAD